MLGAQQQGFHFTLGFVWENFSRCLDLLPVKTPSIRANVCGGEGITEGD